MTNTATQDPSTYIPQFSPINQIERKYHSQLASQLRLQSFAKDELIIRKTGNPKLMHFLVEGTVEIRESFDKRHVHSATNANNQNSLESLLSSNCNVKASDDCLVLVANTEYVDQLLTWGQDYTIFYLDEGDVSIADNTMIDDDFHEDWDNVFIRSNLASHLSNSVIHQIMSQLEDVIVAADEPIVKANTYGDYFYVIKTGRAIVETAADGPFKGERFQLNPGHYFGDEALVAETTRNATVSMATEGVLGRLNIELFNQLIKQHLVSTINEGYESQQEEIRIIDVRHPVEYQQGHVSGSDNIPISFLRQKMTGFKESLMYVVTPANDRRAELATYIMRQAGFKAYHLSEAPS